MTEAEPYEKTTISVVYCKPGERAETVEMEEKLETTILFIFLFIILFILLLLF